jgi:hypothetical protein
VKLNWKATCIGDKHFSLSFSCYAPPQVTGEKKVGRRLTWRLDWTAAGEQWRRHAVGRQEG